MRKPQPVRNRLIRAAELSWLVREGVVPGSAVSAVATTLPHDHPDLLARRQHPLISSEPPAHSGMTWLTVPDLTRLLSTQPARTSAASGTGPTGAATSPFPAGTHQRAPSAASSAKLTLPWSASGCR